MHALVCQGKGKYYVSAVFGYFKDITATDNYCSRYNVRKMHAKMQK
jgi:hypothetical protein